MLVDAIDLNDQKFTILLLVQTHIVSMRVYSHCPDSQPLPLDVVYPAD
jgi:hypothetical protein